MTKQSANTVCHSTIMATLLPSDVMVAELRGKSDSVDIYPEERAYLQRCSDKRINDFVAGRLCAKQALHRLGISNFPLLVGKNREPIWPDNVVGSITHTDDFIAAAAAYSNTVSSIGIDVEQIIDNANELLDIVTTASEKQWLLALPAAQQPLLLTLLFSAKEAFYKCQYPLTNQWLDFHDVVFDHQSFDTNNNFFNIAFANPENQTLSTYSLSAKYHFNAHHVYTAISLTQKNRRL